VLLGIAVVLFCVAFYFASQPSTQVTETLISSNIGTGLASLGFALAGGMALFACALVKPDPPAKEAP
jgi:hypothetical protein